MIEQHSGLSFRMRHTRWLRAVLLWTTVSLPAAMPCTAEDWPQFLGPHRSGKSSETGLIDTFPQAGPRVIWRVPGGVGMSGVAIQGDLATTLVEREGRQWMIALSVENGDERWACDLAPAYENTMGDGPRATPTLDGDTGFVFTGEGILAAVDLTNGRLRWSENLPEQFHAMPSDYGMSCSPLVTENHVIVTIGAETATLVACDKVTGKVAWSAGGGSAAGYSSPVLASFGNAPQVVAFAGSLAISADPSSGRLLWSYPFETDFSCNTACPVLVGSNIFLSSGENHGCVLLQPPTTTDGTVTEVWTSLGPKSVMRNEWQTSVLIGDHLYGFDNVGSAGPVSHLACVEAKTGKKVWQQLRFGKGNLIAADGKLWCTTMNGELVIVAATPEKYQELGRAEVIGQTRQAPSLANGRLYLRDGQEVICVDIKKEP